MSRKTHSRRGFMKSAALAAGGAILYSQSATGARSTTVGGPHLACNQYPWLTYYRRDGRGFNASLDASMADSDSATKLENATAAAKTEKPATGARNENMAGMARQYDGPGGA